MSEGAQRDPSS